MTPLYKVRSRARSGDAVEDQWRYEVVADVDVSDPKDPWGEPLDKGGEVIWLARTKRGAENFAKDRHEYMCRAQGMKP